jgi:hypothetical protein
MRQKRDEKLEHAYFAQNQGDSWVVIPFGDGWIAAQRLAVQEGHMVVSELRVYPLERPRRGAGEWSRETAAIPKGGLSTTLLRRGAPVGVHAVAPVVRDWVEEVGFKKSGWPNEARQIAERVARQFSLFGGPQPRESSINRGRPGRKPSRDYAFYEEVAADYRRWSKQTPARNIAEKWGVSHATARTWIHTARHKLKLLPQTRAGRGSLFMDETQPPKGHSERRRRR